ncbi:MAG: DUF6263 family protein [Lentisphaeraceae bacterium]|nr:DUF6263 family protein [Lentisphaeraceae bacterium]
MKKLTLLLLLSLSTLSLAAEKIKLELKLKAGDIYGFEYIMKQKIQQDIQGRKVSTKQHSGTTYDLEVQEQMIDGYFKLKCTYRHALLEMENTMMTVKYNSRTHKGPIPPPAMGLASLLNQSFTMEVSNNGKVRNVQGMDKIIKNMIESLPSNNAALRIQMKAQFNQAFGNEAIQKLMQQSFDIYPDKAVAVNDTWKDEQIVKTLYPIKVKSNWLLEKFEKGGAVIKVDATLNSNATFKMSGLDCKANLTGTQKGHMTVDLKSGFCRESKLIQDIKGKLDMMQMIVPITIESEITQRTIKK